MSTRILVVDDDPGISEMVALLLESEGYDVTVCANGSSVVALYRVERPDLVLLDVMLPGLDGVSVCKHLREESDVPIIMMSARTDSLDVIAGLEAGADDYVTKPFENSVLLARVKTRLRRQEPESETLRVADLTVDLKGHQVLRDGKDLRLTRSSSIFLPFWLASRGRFSRERNCWNRCGAIVITLPIRGSSTSTSSACVRRWRRTRIIQKWS